ncbi:carbohydrate deacetylase isoform X1 [Tenrec ecaudatus]|uniref:carbohydrate deacetylase isoform X1 n=1 Tax=Tenrec ecaudatus TaxID=94439 RepID=UPI003F59448B
MAGPRVHLVITADDFGYCPRRDEGIVEAFLVGAVTSVSLLVNGAATESAAELARRHSIPTGLHANLSEGRPVGPARHGASSLLGPEGFFLGKMGFRKALAAGDVALAQVQGAGGAGAAGGVVRPREPADGGDLPGVPRDGSLADAPGITVLPVQVREELEAQLSRFRELLGRDPTHVDGHQHVHVLPGVCQVFAEVLQAFGVRFTRLPLERGVGGCAWLEAPALSFACAVERDARAAMGPFTRHGLRWADAFVGLSTCGRHMSAHRVAGALARALENVPAGRAMTVELMAHPGYPSVPPAGGCGEGPDAFSCSWERLHELRVLTAPTLRARLAQDGVQLCALDDLDSKRLGEGPPSESTLETSLDTLLP